MINLFVPGRLCLFGEHTDWASLYRTVNSSIVKGAAIVCGTEQGIYALAEKDVKFRMCSSNDMTNELQWECEMDTLKLNEVAQKGGYFSYVAGVASYINDNYSQITSIEQIAEQFFISKYHLCRIFKDALHITLIDYLNEVKIKNARYYIESTNKSFITISKLCGFNSLSYFSTVFKKIVGQSPSEYRKEIKQ